MVLHFQAIQPGQQDRRRQARGEKADRVARDDRDDPVAPGESFEEREGPRLRFGQLRVCDDGRQRPVEVAEDPGRRRVAAKRCEQVGIVGHSPTVPTAPAPHRGLPPG